MDKVIPSRQREKVFLYLDDLLVFTPDFKTDIDLLKGVARCMSAAGLTINVEKVVFAKRI